MDHTAEQVVTEVEKKKSKRRSKPTRSIRQKIAGFNYPVVFFIINGTNISKNQPKISDYFYKNNGEPALLLKYLKMLKNPFSRANGVPLQGKDHLFFAFEKSRRNLSLTLMTATQQQQFLKDEASLNEKMKY